MAQGIPVSPDYRLRQLAALEEEARRSGVTDTDCDSARSRSPSTARIVLLFFLSMTSVFALLALFVSRLS